MMYLGIRTDSPEAELYVYKDKTLIDRYMWSADRRLAKELLGQLETFLVRHDMTFESLNGLFCFKGPGSFTGLRIGLTVMNTLAYSLALPIVGEEGDEWTVKSVERLTAGETDQIVLPLYGADPRITSPRK